MKEIITLLKGGITKNLKAKKPYSKSIATALSFELFKKAYEGETTIEGIAYQRGLENGICLILDMIDEINKEDE